MSALNASLLAGLVASKQALRAPDAGAVNDRSTANPAAFASPDALAEEEERWKYFFDSGASSWFDAIKDFTFSSTFCSLTPEEAAVIVGHWEKRERCLACVPTVAASMPGSAASAGDGTLVTVEEELAAMLTEATDALSGLVDRLDAAVEAECAKSPAKACFVKLSTRSPKDSRKILAKAAVAFRARLAALEEKRAAEAAGAAAGVERSSTAGEAAAASAAAAASTVTANERWIMLSEEVACASAVRSGAEALELLLDSARVFEDLEYALRGPPIDGNTDGNTDGKATEAIPRAWNMALVARSWDPRLTPAAEFRGICWGGKLTCLAQYFHPLFFAHLQSPAALAAVERDVRACCAKASGAIAGLGGHCIVDFAWLGEGEVVLIELNPFDGVCLGTFPASTGLFLWDDPADRKIMTGEAPFEFRVRSSPLGDAALKANGNVEWREIVHPSQHAARR